MGYVIGCLLWGINSRHIFHVSTVNCNKKVKVAMVVSFSGMIVGADTIMLYQEANIPFLF